MSLKAVSCTGKKLKDSQQTKAFLMTNDFLVMITECRKQHRKCVRLDDTDLCKRCSRLQLVCLLPSTENDFDPNESVDGTKQLKRMLATVNLLQHTIHQVEVEMEWHRQRQAAYTTVFTDLDTEDSIKMGKSRITQAPLDPFCWLDDTLSESGGSSATNQSSNKDSDECCKSDESMIIDCNDRPSSATSTSSVILQSFEDRPHHQQQQQHQHQHQDRLLLKNGKEWKVSMVKGQWRIDTDITTLSGLDQLYQVLYSSPSPFQGIHLNTPIVIQACDTRTIFPLTIKLARNHLLYNTQRRALQNGDQHGLFSTPDLLIQRPKWVVDRLVYMFLKCYNPSMTFVHHATYLAYYQQLKDPLACPVTMALCSYVCCGHHNASTPGSDNNDVYYDDNGMEWFSSMMDRRAMGEYFYRQCRHTLDDIFDDPQRRLETVMAINILKRFLMNTLRVSEMRKLETIAYLICVDLKPFYQSPAHASKQVEREIYARHYAFSIWCHVAVDFFMDSISSHGDVDFIRLSILPGESEFTWKFLHLQNHFFDILLDPSVYIVYENVQKILLGDKVEMTLELILRFEQVTMKWWEQLPTDLRLCDNPYDFDNVKLIIQQTQDDTKLTLFIFFLDVAASFHYCLLKIQVKMSNNGGGDMPGMDKDVLSHIHERSLKACLDLAEMMILSVNKLDTNVGYSQCKYIWIDYSFIHCIANVNTTLLPLAD